MKYLIAALVVLLAGCGVKTWEETEQGRYEKLCQERGGFVSKYAVDPWHGPIVYNCVGQTSGPQMPELKS